MVKNIALYTDIISLLQYDVETFNPKRIKSEELLQPDSYTANVLKKAYQTLG